MFLEVVSFARDVGDDFNAVGQTNLGHLAESGVRLLWRRGVNTGAHTATLRARCESARLCLLDLRLASFANQLLDRWHVNYRLFAISFW